MSLAKRLAILERTVGYDKTMSLIRWQDGSILGAVFGKQTLPIKADETRDHFIARALAYFGLKP